MQKYSCEIAFGNTKIKLETGLLAPQANASVLATWGKTVVLATVALGKLDENKDYFPLSVEYMDKLFAGGAIKGGKWMKREGGPSDASVLFGRIIDRSIRPLFPEGFHNEVQVIATVLSNDKEHDPVVTAFIAASAAISISDIPFNGPVSGVRVGYIDKQHKIFPTVSELKQSEMDLLVCTGPSGVNMIEADAKIVADDIVYAGVELAKNTADQINAEIAKFATECAKTKITYEPYLPSLELVKEVEEQIKTDVESFLEAGVDGGHMIGEKEILQKVHEIYKEKIESAEININFLHIATSEIVKKYLRNRTLAGTRYDKRATDEIRPLSILPGVLPCTHGSALFQRGLTQALTVTTLAPLTEMQTLEDSSGESNKRYLHYYDAMPFSTGEAGRVGRPGRREIGHGALAEKALIPVIPSETDFPYTIMLTSEVLSQNGSSSMASTCGSTMSMLDAGVPLKDKVAGISVGMVSDGDEKYQLLTDIAGIEDHYGDMDFKITGTRNGITAIQLDIKRQGLTLPMIKDTFAQSSNARMKIIALMDEVLPEAKKELSVYAPKIKIISLPEDKIGDVIGSGGKTIKALMAKYGVQIDIDDFGRASISSLDTTKVDAAAFEIESMVRDIQIGEEFEDGLVTRVEQYGAFVEFLPGREALLHVSEMSTGFISDPSKIIKVGDKIKVQVSGFNENRQLKLAAPEFKAAHQGEERAPQQQFNKFNSDFRSPQRQRPRR
jgi:polyribonucleotide nucleotidyltransferase